MTAPPSSSPTRRRLLAWGGTGILGLGLFGWMGRPRRSSLAPVEPATSSSLPAEPPVTLTDTETLTNQPLADGAHPDFAPLVGTEFTVKHPDENEARCKLVEASPLRIQETPRGKLNSFTLLFEAEPGFLRHGGICRVTHPDLQAMDLFLSPVGKPAAERTYLEACFTERA